MPSLARPASISASDGGRRISFHSRSRSALRSARSARVLSICFRAQSRLSASRAPRMRWLSRQSRPRPSSEDVFSPEYRRSEEHTSELQSLMRISYAVFCLKKKKERNKIDRKDKEK